MHTRFRCSKEDGGLPANPLWLETDGTDQPPLARPRRREGRSEQDALAMFVDGVPDPATIELQGMIRSSVGIPRGTAYDPHRTYTRSTNEHDHDAKIRVSVPKGIMALVNEAADKYPGYRTPHDVLRDALVHRLWWLAEHHEQLVGLRGIDDYAVEMAVAQEHDKVIQRQRNIDQARDVLAKIEVMEDWTTYERVVERYSEYVGGLEPPWDSKMAAVVADARERMSRARRTGG